MVKKVHSCKTQSIVPSGMARVVVVPLHESEERGTCTLRPALGVLWLPSDLHPTGVVEEPGVRWRLWLPGTVVTVGQESVDPAL